MKSSLLILGLKSAQADATRKEIKTIDYDQDEQEFDNFVTAMPLEFETAEPWGTALVQNDDDEMDTYQLCSALPKYESWKCRKNECRYKCKQKQTAQCLFDHTTRQYRWSGTPNPYCIVEAKLPKIQRYQEPQPRSRPTRFESCNPVFGQEDYWKCAGKRCEVTCKGDEFGSADQVKPHNILTGYKPRAYGNEDDADITYQVQCLCRPSGSCAFAGYLLPPCMAKLKAQQQSNRVRSFSSGIHVEGEEVYSDEIILANPHPLIDVFVSPHHEEQIELVTSTTPNPFAKLITTPNFGKERTTPSQYVLENRFAMEPPKTNVWGRLKGSVTADWIYCQDQIIPEQWHCSQATCKSICQGTESKPLLPIQGVKPIQGVSIIRCYCTGLECSFANIQETAMPNCAGDPDYVDVDLPEGAPLMYFDVDLGQPHPERALDEVEEDEEQTDEDEASAQPDDMYDQEDTTELPLNVTDIQIDYEPEDDEQDILDHLNLEQKISIEELADKLAAELADELDEELGSEEEQNAKLAKQVAIATRPNTYSGWDIEVPPLPNAKPKRYIRCERSLGKSRKWWLCDSQFCKTKCSKNKPIRCFCNNETCRFSGIVKPSCLMRRMQRLGLLNAQGPPVLQERSFNPGFSIGQGVSSSTTEKKNRNKVEIKSNHFKPNKVINESVRTTVDGKWVNIRDIFNRIKDYLARFGIKFV